MAFLSILPISQYACLTPHYRKFDASRCLESCRLCLDACPSQAIYAVYRKGDKLLVPQKMGRVR